MAHKVKVEKVEKKENVVSVNISVKIDGEQAGYKELNGKELKTHFDLSYQIYSYKDSVERHAKVWANNLILKEIERMNPSGNQEGKEIEI